MKFMGYYIKCTTVHNDTIAIIFGKAEYSFVQIITKEKSYWQKSDWKFSKKGITLNIENAKGNITFGTFSHPKYHAMGPLRFLPFLECKHTVLSMYHEISGKLTVGGKNYNFDGGRGYIEGDYGKSFPQKYFWTQSFLSSDVYVFAAAAKIPYLGLKLNGTVCIIHQNGLEYRLATYLGARVITFTKDTLKITQRKKVFEIYVSIPVKNKRELFAPINGKMTRAVVETVQTLVRFKFVDSGKTVFDITDPTASFEYSVNT